MAKPHPVHQLRLRVDALEKQVTLLLPLLEQVKLLSQKLPVGPDENGTAPEVELKKELDRERQLRVQLEHQCAELQQRLDKTSGDTAAEVSSALNIVLNPATKQHLSHCLGINDRHVTFIQELMSNSSNFPIRYPVTSVLCRTLLNNNRDVDRLGHHINSAYPLVHEGALHLFINFLEHKRLFGNEIEKTLYTNMKLMDFVQRLLHKRAITFYGRDDKFKLLNGKNGIGGWEHIGKTSQMAPLILSECLSYDEIKLSAFLSVSSYSFFINDGRRDNKGIPAASDSVLQTEGVIVGLVGSRLEKKGVMDCEELLVSIKQNTKYNGYGPEEDSALNHWRRMWASFFGIASHLPTYVPALASEEGLYTSISGNMLFNNKVYKKRVALIAETLLLEAESRAAACGTTAYVNVVGVGLGIWSVSGHQELLFLDSFIECLRRLAPVIPHVSDLRFLWFKCRRPETIRRNNGNVIHIHFSNSAPHEKLIGEDAGKLLVTSYTCSGNALPGNEFWDGMLTSSGDPAAACSSQVTELHNPHVNQRRVNSCNLHVATTKWGVLHISEYAQKKQLTMDWGIQ